MQRSRTAAWILMAFFLLGVQHVFAGPPFQTDDPDPVDYRHFEAYFFGSSDGTSIATATLGPAFEVNWGAVPNVQLHLIVPMAGYVQPHGPNTFGLGDTELGVKYRFVKETPHRPEIGIFPFLEVPTGSASRNLGNGKTWARLPLWLQKSKGSWTTYGGAGEVVNTAQGTNNYTFGGWLLQRQISKKLALGGEVFSHGAEGSALPSTRSSAMFDFGGIYNFTPGFSLLFAGGHSFAGQAETYTYAALYWTWGEKPKEQKSGLSSTVARMLRPDAGNFLGN